MSEHVKARKGDLVYVEHQRTGYTMANGTRGERETSRVFAIVESCTRDGLVKVARDAHGMPYYGPGAPIKDRVTCYGAREVLLVPRDKLSASPADILAALGTEPWPHAPQHDRVRSFPSREAAIDALRPYRSDLTPAHVASLGA